MLILKIVDKILNELGLSNVDTLSRNSDILCRDAIYALIIEDTIKDAAALLEVSEDILEQVLRRYFRLYCNKDSKTKWSIFLLSLVLHKKCIKCKDILPYTEFSINQDRYDSKNCICKTCDALKNKSYSNINREACRARSREHYLLNKSDYLARNANKRAIKLKATPLWADLGKIKEIYHTCPEGYHVDHIIPLQGELVCGLHVESNLQHLSAIENLQKSNKWEVK